jgi:hypothetical protein
LDSRYHRECESFRIDSRTIKGRKRFKTVIKCH